MLGFKADKQTLQINYSSDMTSLACVVSFVHSFFAFLNDNFPLTSSSPICQTKYELLFFAPKQHIDYHKGVKGLSIYIYILKK